MAWTEVTFTRIRMLYAWLELIIVIQQSITPSHWIFYLKVSTRWKLNQRLSIWCLNATRISAHGKREFSKKNLCLILEIVFFSFIKIPEVLMWSREQNEEHSPNLTKFTQHFNNMSYWCRTRILEQEEPKDRERFLMKFIKVMKYLRRLNNFNSYLAVLSALDSAPVRRLEWQRQNMEVCVNHWIRKTIWLS